MYKSASRFNNRGANAYISKRLKKNKKDSIKLFDRTPNRVIKRKKKKIAETSITADNSVTIVNPGTNDERKIIKKKKDSYKITVRMTNQKHKLTAIEIAFQKAQEKNNLKKNK